MTFTGPGEQTDLSALVQFQRDFPTSEIGVLILPRFTGGARYPNVEWIKTFCSLSPGQRALHLCEDAIETFLAYDPASWGLAEKFGCVQLNIFQAKWPVRPDHVDLAARRFFEQTGGRVIVPMNSQNESMVLALTGSYHRDYL